MNVIVFDTETTGLSPRNGDRVIEIGAVKLENGVVIDEFQSLINPGRSIPYQAQAVHGISQSMLCDQPLPADVFPEFYDFIGSITLVAHNAPFDLRFLTAEFNLLGLNLQTKIECTMKLSRKCLSQLSNHRLDTVYRHLGGVEDSSMQRHRALDDARMAAFIWVELNKY